ncbi:MAG: helicase C-terminal domain-containing protein, partial [Opitutales bacterium]
MIGFNDEIGAAPRIPSVSSRAEKVFAPHGWLQDVLGLEHRGEQETMARAVSQAIDEEAPLLFEAGTGVGKSIAYLLPSLIHAIDAERPCLVSTNTKALQEQIQNNDLTLSRSLFNKIPELKAYRDFRSTVLMGKSNYLCTTRLMRTIEDKADLFGGPDQEELERLLHWSNQTENGLIQELIPPPSRDVWETVNADSSSCNRKNCTPKDCPYQRARARLHKAQVIIVNHSLLFALLNAGQGPAKGRGILFPNDFLVIDEAHTVPAVATEHFGLNLSSYGLDRLLLSLYNPRKEKGLLLKLGKERDIDFVRLALQASETFFTGIQHNVLRTRDMVRIREADWCEPILADPLRAVIQTVATIANRVEGRHQEELTDKKNRLESYYGGLTQCIGLAATEHVHWIERKGRKGQIVTLRNAPIDVAPLLKTALFERKTTVILTSATLAPAGNIAAFQSQVGSGNAKAHIVDSPFDFERNMRIFVATDIPLPTPDKAHETIEALADYIRFCVNRVEGGSLVLFTSYSDMNKAAQKVEPEMTKSGRPFFIQGSHLPRTELTRHFTKAQNGVLFGTDSFWTGVDVPGKALSQVIVTRLPFENPTQPITAAPCELIRAQGGNTFSE